MALLGDQAAIPFVCSEKFKACQRWFLLFCHFVAGDGLVAAFDGILRSFYPELVCKAAAAFVLSLRAPAAFVPNLLFLPTLDGTLFLFAGCGGRH